MNVKDVMNLPWVKVKDWSELPATYYSSERQQFYVRRSDITIFTDNLYHEISRKLEIPYEELKHIIKQQNKPFYKLKLKLFLGVCYGTDHNSLLYLENLLRVPYVSSIDILEHLDNVTRCVELFEELSKNEKKDFLNKIGVSKKEKK